MSCSTKGGLLTLVRVRAPSIVRPGQPFTVSADITNGATLITPIDPDICEGGSNPCSRNVGESVGYCINVEYFVDGQKVGDSGSDCIRIAEIGANRETKETTVQIDSAGNHTVGARVTLPGSGKSTCRLDTSVVVDEDAPKEPSPPPSDGNGGNGQTLLQTVVENPIKAGIVTIGGTVALREAIGGE